MALHHRSAAVNARVGRANGSGTNTINGGTIATYHGNAFGVVNRYATVTTNAHTASSAPRRTANVAPATTPKRTIAEPVAPNATKNVSLNCCDPTKLPSEPNGWPRTSAGTYATSTMANAAPALRRSSAKTSGAKMSG